MIPIEPISESTSDEIKCTSHQDKYAQMVCIDCQITLCDICMKKSFKNHDHANHSMEEVDEFLVNRKHEKDAKISVITKSRDEVDKVYETKMSEIDDSVKTNIESIKQKANSTIEKIRKWEKGNINDINSKANEIKRDISTKYHKAGKNLPTVESIEDEGVFDESHQKVPSEKFVSSMEELISSTSRLMVTANLKLSTTSDVRKKETTHVSKINLLYS